MISLWSQLAFTMFLIIITKENQFSILHKLKRFSFHKVSLKRFDTDI